MSSSQKIERVPVYKLMKVNVTKRISGQNIGQSDGQHWRGNMWMAFANTSDCKLCLFRTIINIRLFSIEVLETFLLNFRNYVSQ